MLQFATARHFYSMRDRYMPDSLQPHVVCLLVAAFICRLSAVLLIHVRITRRMRAFVSLFAQNARKLHKA